MEVKQPITEEKFEVITHSFGVISIRNEKRVICTFAPKVNFKESHSEEFNYRLSIAGVMASAPDLLSENQQLKKDKEELIKMLEMIYNIEDVAFGLKSFNVEDLKRKIERLINQHKGGE